MLNAHSKMLYYAEESINNLHIIEILNAFFSSIMSINWIEKTFSAGLAMIDEWNKWEIKMKFKEKNIKRSWYTKVLTNDWADFRRIFYVHSLEIWYIFEIRTWLYLCGVSLWKAVRTHTSQWIFSSCTYIKAHDSSARKKYLLINIIDQSLL